MKSNYQRLSPTILLLLLLLLLQLSACLKDKGNYNYNEINRVKIKKIDSIYYVNYGERLQIKPVLEFTKDTDADTANYTYSWVNDRTTGNSNRSVVIANSRDMDMIVKMDYGNYFMYYRVTDKRTGVFSDSYFYLNVGSPSYQGWMLLCDMENDKSRLDMVSVRSGTDTLYRDILKEVRSTYQLSGKPAFIASNYSDLAGNFNISIFAATSRNAAILGSDSLEYHPDGDLTNYVQASDPVTDWTDAEIYLRPFGGLLYANKRIYSIEDGAIVGPVNFQDDAATPFTPSRWVNQATSRGAILFNEDNKTFLYFPGTGTNCQPLPAGNLFNFNTGMELLFSTYVPYNGGEIFSVLKNTTNGKRFLARFTMKGQQNYFAEISGEDISSASQFAVSPDLGYLFYNVNGKIYEYDPLAKRSFLMRDYGNRKVSLMKFQTFVKTATDDLKRDFYLDLGRKLLVCSYLPGKPEDSGTFDIFSVPEVNGPLQLNKSYSGTGKVTSITYRER